MSNDVLHLPDNRLLQQSSDGSSRAAISMENRLRCQTKSMLKCLLSPGRANHWSAIIGASHSKNYVLWEYGGFASDGVKQVAELGSPVKMEEEIRQKVRLT